MNWKMAAIQAEEDYGSFVDYTERFFICPECGEPVYEGDWNDTDFEDCICPICGFFGS